MGKGEIAKSQNKREQIVSRKKKRSTELNVMNNKTKMFLTQYGK